MLHYISSAEEQKISKAQARKLRLEVVTVKGFQDAPRPRRASDCTVSPMRAVAQRAIHRLVLLLRVERMEQRILQSHLAD